MSQVVRGGNAEYLRGKNDATGWCMRCSHQFGCAGAVDGGVRLGEELGEMLVERSEVWTVVCARQ